MCNAARIYWNSIYKTFSHAFSPSEQLDDLMQNSWLIPITTTLHCISTQGRGRTLSQQQTWLTSRSASWSTSFPTSKAGDLFLEQRKFHPKSSDKQLSHESTQTWFCLNVQSLDCQCNHGPPAQLQRITRSKHIHRLMKGFVKWKLGQLHRNQQNTSEESGSKLILSCF